MMYRDFKGLKEDVSETYESMAQLVEKFDWGFFTDEACNQIRAYEVLADIFKRVYDSEDLVDRVANEISWLKGKVKDDDDREVIKNLVKYVRENFSDELWDQHAEFNLSHLHRGC